MQLLDIRMKVSDLDAAADFYQQVLQLPVARGEGGAEVTVGTSKLTLRRGSGGTGSHHLAFTVPADQFGSAKCWLANRVPLLQRAGVDEFSLPPPWHSRSVYFLGPENVLLELIARHDLPTGGLAPFSPANLLCISEIGVAVHDVEAASRAARESFGLDRFDSGGPGFAPLGDHHGLLIVVATGRVWFPTPDLTPSPDALAVTFDPGRGSAAASRVLGRCTLRSVAGAMAADQDAGDTDGVRGPVGRPTGESRG